MGVVKDWYVYIGKDRRSYFVVDTEDGVPVHSDRASMRDIAQATIHGKMRERR